MLDKSPNSDTPDTSGNKPGRLAPLFAIFVKWLKRYMGAIKKASVAEAFTINRF